MAQDTFYGPGESTFTVPDRVNEVTLEVFGAGGGDGKADDTFNESADEGSGDDGGYVTGTLTVSPGDTLTFELGGEGETPLNASDGRASGGQYGGGDGGYVPSDAAAGGGGGYTRVLVNGSTELVVGGGAGGSAAAHDETGGNAVAGSSGAGGAIGDGYDGGSPSSPTDDVAQGGEGGTTSGGGAGGSGGNEPGNDGGSYQAGDGVSLDDFNTRTASGGAGAGRFGGGSGALNTYDTFAGAGGSGGGSGYDGPAFTVTESYDGYYQSNGDAEITVEYQVPPSAPQNVEATGGIESVSVDWDPAEFAQEYTVFRSEYSNVDANDTQVGTTTSTSFTDTNLPAGKRYYYAVCASNAAGSSDVSESDFGVTDLSAPTLGSFESISADELAYSWTADHADGQTRVEYRAVGTTNWTVADTVSRATETATVTGVDNGTEYEGRVVATTDDADSPSNTLSDITTLPDEDQPVLGNGVLDEIEIDRENAVTNAGDVRYQIRRSEDAPDWESAPSFQQFIGAYDTTVFEFVGLLDGERYDVRGRTETDATTGAWTDSTSIVTQFPGVDNLRQVAVGTTSAEIAWDDIADNEDGQEVIRERLVGGEWRREEVLEDVGPDTESFVDDTVQPDTTYRYRVRSYTPYAEAESDTIEVTTDDIGLSRRRVPATGWYVELDTNDGDTLRPTVLEGATPKAALNDVPRVEIPVPDADRWERDTLQRCEMRVWRDGERLPIERFERPVRQSDPPRTVLHGRGGIELDTDVELDVGPVTDVDDVVRDLLGDETPYAYTVDDPDNNLRDDVGVVSGSGTIGLVDTLASIDAQFGNDTPFVVETGGPGRPTQVAWLGSVRYDASERTANLARAPEESVGKYMDNRVYSLESVGDSIEWDFNVDYDVTVDDLDIRLRRRIPVEGENPALSVEIDGEKVAQYPADVPGAGPHAGSNWYQFGTGLASNPDKNLGDGGSTTLRVEVTEASSSADGEWLVDGYCASDSRYDDQLDYELGNGVDAIDENGIIEGPQLYPAAVEVETIERALIEQVVAGRLTVDVSDTTGEQALAISNDGGETWVKASNTTEVSGAFADGNSTTIRGRITLGRVDGDPTEHPRTGGAPQTLSSFELFATLDDTPFIQNGGFTGTVAEVLQTIADTHYFIWEVAWDPDANGGDGGISIEWTQPGQRQASTSAAVLEYETEIDAETVVEEAIVYGRSRRVRDQEVTLNVGSYTGVGDGYLQPGTERVVDPDTDEVFTPGEDYQILASEGVIQATAGGAITDGQTVVMDYETRLVGRYSLPGADGSGDTIRRTVESATTQNLANQAAQAIVRELSEPLVGADVTLDRTADLGLVGALDIDDVPAEAEVVRNLEERDATLTVTLGNRQSAGAVIDAIRSQIEAVAKRL